MRGRGSLCESLVPSPRSPKSSGLEFRFEKKSGEKEKQVCPVFKDLRILNPGR